MIKNLPLFYYPTTCVCVDDDQTLLQCMPMAFEAFANSKLFSSAESCLNFLNHYQPQLSDKHFLKSNRDDECYGILQHTPTDFDITKIAALIDNLNRHDEVTTMVIDYQMPVMNGFSLAKKCQHLLINKILLTGMTQDEEVIAGFNQNYIQRFVQKSDLLMEEKLISHIKDLSMQYFQRMTMPLLAHLEVENLMPLSDPVFISFFQAYCAQKNITEYYLIDKQGSFLCMNKAGKKLFLIMHNDISLDAWLDAYGTENALSRELIQAIRCRKKVYFFGMGKEAWNIDCKQWANHFYTPSTLIGRQRYFWFELEG
ncbi:MAG: hypothetical protein COY58_09070 [Gammaproteobacteria bacterium CG_4_10_14_0_8_um_filter_38_16]|nr:MAG: hypothetical protein COY58_09070 [Gammaproteobacteria bacterium CG_4_10_14_0_8_um_filter_38_16]PJA03392.1 MAG: hypothetical protein COX72_05505 [Gammaproteobacteria bacterium CG_4_10_14_0_2_um_filter_38_22]PJB11120.1 MAG: hypothetical protein CO120_01225 [Gammaproteobacteria bacterium CG_4_9_14_3_um_filter_38_9]